MDLSQEVACPITGTPTRPERVVKAGQYRVGWFPAVRLWSVIDTPSVEQMAAAYQNFNAGEHARDNFDHYVRQAVPILSAEVLRAGVDPDVLGQLALLDYGCGGGHFVAAASRLGMRAKGMELDSTAAAAGRSAGLDIVDGVLPRDLAGLRGQNFDVIKMSHVLEHVPNPRQLLECLKSLLNPGGVLIINVPDQDSFPSLLKIVLRRFGIKRGDFGFVQPPIHLHGFTTASFDAVASTLGMKLTVCYGYSPLDEKNFPTAPDYWRGIAVQKLVYSIGRALGSGGYMTAMLRNE